MLGEDKVKVFEKELAVIKDRRIKNWASWAIAHLPDYFFKIPASSTNKYHPEYATGDGGLVRHTQAAVRTAHTLLSTETFGDKYEADQKDLIIAALLIHDGLKKGLPEERYTNEIHPVLVCDYLDGAFAAVIETDRDLYPEDRYIAYVYKLVKSHMGQWNTNKDGKEILPKPSCKGSSFVHLCDYLASRKLFEVNFNAQF